MEKETKQESQRAQVETLAEDMARVIENDKEGLIKKIIHEQEMKEAEKRNLSPESKKNKVFMLLSFMLVTISMLTFIYFLYQDGPAQSPVTPQFNSMIYVDKTVFLRADGLNKDQTTALILNEIKNVTLKSKGIEAVYLTLSERVIGLSQFLAIFRSEFIPNSFMSPGFLLGVVNNDTKDPFILLKARNFSDVFDDFKSWEDKMFSELHGLFSIPINSTTNYLATKDFENGIVDNKNARILYDKEGGIVMMYVFADESSIVITNTIEATAEVVLRVFASSVEK